MSTRVLGRLQRGGLTALAVVGLGLAVACAPATEPTPIRPSVTASQPSATPVPKLSGVIEIDGSSTVFPITEAVAEEFRKVHPDVRVNVGVSGTGGGFKRFVVGETDISDASRPIKSIEGDTAKQNGIEYTEVRVAIDGLAVVVHRQNTFATCLTTAELKRIWEPGSRVQNWQDVRPEFPNQPLRLYGPGTDSGTFDYFTETINGKEDASRADYTASEDDNVLVRGIVGDRNALGYFGYAYYTENKDKLALVAVDAGKGCITPTDQTVKDFSYRLSRPLFIYLNTKKLAARPELLAFVEFYLEQAPTLVAEVGYVPFEAAAYQAEMENVAAALR